MLTNEIRGQAVSADMFRVDIDQMRAMITKLRYAETAMRDAMGAMHGASPDNVGTKKLDGACNEFQKKWKYGLGQIEKDIDATLEGLTEVLTLYAEVERALADLYHAQITAMDAQE